ncbi:unnamed protein product [Adineta steineri]|uniref:N-alpha-acetyltransferase 60 n=1 Tax=Adineta steineri TaxID=433720 RepID=A0A813PVC4_9BILA|nr:unnamed protein product [Adineta steineri]CAF0867305.1 unnamed protein product [Adineta steineri]
MQTSSPSSSSQSTTINLYSFDIASTKEFHVLSNSNISISFRFLRPGDQSEVKSLCCDWFPIEYPDKWYDDIVHDTKYFALAACETGTQRIVGLVIADIVPLGNCNHEDQQILHKSFSLTTPVCYILILGVVKEYRRQGLAGILLQQLLNTLYKRGTCKAVYLHVLFSNKQAIQFYETNSFQYRVHLPYYYCINGENFDGYCFALYINGGCPPFTLSDYFSNWWTYLRKFEFQIKFNNDMSSIQVSIIYFGRLRELVGISSEKIDFDPSISYTQQTILDRIIEHRPILKTFLITNSFRVAVNQQYLLESDLIEFTQQSEIALLPPFGGDELYKQVIAPSCGAVASFIGITRDNFEGRQVARLFYEAYESMALQELKRLCDDARRQFGDIKHIAICHRLGDVSISEASVAIYVSGPHRRDALDAVSFLIEQLKANVPIWKKEFYEDHEGNNGNSNNNENNTSTSSYCWKENK